MKFRLQLFGFDQSAYERPNQKWVCGWASAGNPCHHGPDAHGRCCGGFVCQPIKNGARWICSRSAAAGGPCAQGPTPEGGCCQAVIVCRPVRSLRARRGLVAAWTFAMTAAVLCLGLARWPRFISPGPLSIAHAPILAGAVGSGERGCAACHRAVHGWITSLDDKSSADSVLCLECHKNEAHFHSAQFAMLPHGVPPSLLSTPIPSAAKATLVSKISLDSFVPAVAPGQVACAACHHEHRVPQGKLALMDDQTCQACHNVKFSSFNAGHPEFTQHHESADHTVVFSHATHRDQHFGAEKFECAACHTPSPDGRMRTASFESSCAGCHGQHSNHFNGNDEPSKTGIVLLQIPALDLDTLNKLKVDIGHWPQYDGGVNVHLTPFTRLLLGGDHADYLSHLPPDLSLLTDATDDQILAVQQLARAIKSLLASGGKNVASLNPGLSAALGRPLSEGEFKELTAGLSTDQISAAAAQWFPQLSSELQKPFVKWNPANRPKRSAPAPAATPPTSQPAPPAGGDLLNDAAPAIHAIYADDDLLNGDTSPPATKPSAPATPPTPAPAGGDLLNGDTSPPAPAPAPAPAPTPPPAAPPAPVHTGPAANGWERSDEQFALIYHPMGHANLFLRRWQETLTSHHGAPKPREFQILPDEISDTCTKCHNNPVQSGSTFIWAPDFSDPPPRDFVKFTHTPHLIEPRLADCTACHAFPQPTDAPASVDQIFGFKFIQKDSCITCHAPHLAANSCLACHNYHVTPPADAVAIGPPDGD